jgi:hypothetical protein
MRRYTVSAIEMAVKQGDKEMLMLTRAASYGKQAPVDQLLYAARVEFSTRP